MKKISATILTLAFLMQCFTAVPIRAEDAVWTVTYHGDIFSSEANRTLYTAESTDKSKFEGSKSVMVKCQTAEEIDGNSIELTNPLTANPESGKYTLKFNVRTSTAFDGNVIIGDTVLKISDMTAVAVIPPDGTKNWKEYSCEFDYTKTSDADLSFVFLRNIKASYIDDVTLTASGGTDNLISDYSFENGINISGSVAPPPPPPGPGEEEDPEIPEDNYEPSAYQPLSLLSSGHKTGILLTWINPSADTLTDIKVYDITHGEEILLPDELPVTPSKAVYFKTECTGDNAFQYKIVFSYSDTEDRIYYLSDIPGDKGAKMWGTWSMREYMDGAAKYCPADVYVDSTTGYESNASMKIVSNIDRNVTELKSNIYVLVVNSLSMDSGKRYKISFRVKGEDVINNPQAHMNFAKFEGVGTTMSGMTGTYDWVYKEYTYTYETQHAFTILCEGMCGALWFDDFQCYEIDEDGNIVNETNLFKDGDFEGIVSQNTVSLADFKAEPGIGSINLSYEKPFDKYGGAKLYQLTDGVYEYRGVISADADKFEISGLKENAEYSFKVVPFNSDRYDGEAVEFTVTTLLRDYYITEPVVYKGSTITDSLSGPGEYKVVTTGKNNLLEKNLNYVQMVGIYKGNALVKAYSSKQSIPKTPQDSEPSVTETTFNLPEGEDYSVRIFIMDSKTNPEVYHKLYLN